MPQPARGGRGSTTTMASSQSQSQTQSQTETQTQTQTQTQQPRILRLQGAATSTGRSVQWANDVVDNEGLGRKSSKVCCIYHKPKAVDESSDESSSSDSDSDTDDDGSGHDANGKGKAHDCDGHDHCRGRRQNGEKRRKMKGGDDNGGRRPSPNAYEKVPRVRPRGGGSSAPTTC